MDNIDKVRKHLFGINPVPDFDSLMRTERSLEWDNLKRQSTILDSVTDSVKKYMTMLKMNRKILGAMRYGLMGAEGKPQWDRVPDMIRRLYQFRYDYNAEHLIDVSNLCELEFVEGGRSFKWVGDPFGSFKSSMKSHPITICIYLLRLYHIEGGTNRLLLISDLCEKEFSRGIHDLKPIDDGEHTSEHACQ